MSLAGTLGKYSGIIAAELVWLSEQGIKTGSILYASEIAGKYLSKIAEEHVIDSNDEDAVTNNIFECLQYID